VFNFMVQLRWSDGAKCPGCGSVDVRAIATRKTGEYRHLAANKDRRYRCTALRCKVPAPLPLRACYRRLMACWQRLRRR
jgi:hypothetical protein